MGRPVGSGLRVSESVKGQRGPTGSLDPMDLLYLAEEGECRGDQVKKWFPERGAKHLQVNELMVKCDRCAVQEDCLRYALVHRMDWGVWGGTSERERRRLRRVVLKLAKAEGLTWEQAIDKVVG